MITIFSAIHEQHAPEHEFFRGKLVPCFETPARAGFVIQEITARAHQVVPPSVDSLDILRQVHSERYLTFLETAWDQWVALDPGNVVVQPFPSVWPVRTLRSDLEPTDFIARLGFTGLQRWNGLPHVSPTIRIRAESRSWWDGPCQS